MNRNLEQLKHYKAHYQRIYHYVKTKAKPVVRFQIKKLTQQIHNFRT